MFRLVSKKLTGWFLVNRITFFLWRDGYVSGRTCNKLMLAQTSQDQEGKSRKPSRKPFRPPPESGDMLQGCQVLNGLLGSLAKLNQNMLVGHGTAGKIKVYCKYLARQPILDDPESAKILP